MKEPLDVENLTEEEFIRFAREFAESSPFYKTLDIKVLEMKDGTAKLRIEDIDHLRTPSVYLHGGAIASLADSAMAMAILSHNKRPRSFSTIELKVSYLAPVFDGPITAEARIVKSGKRVIFGESEVFDKDDRLIAQALLTFMYTDVE